jgi:leucyl aminopeptidase (aminopeptidase T)
MAEHNRISEETAQRIAAAWPAILDAIASGKQVNHTLEAAGISRGMVRAFISADPERRVQWDDAREASADAFMDQAMQEAMATIPKDDAAHVRTRIDTLKWAARIRNPRAYAEKTQHEHTVKNYDMTQILKDANTRLAGRAYRILEHDQSVTALLPHIEQERDM